MPHNMRITACRKPFVVLAIDIAPYFLYLFDRHIKSVKQADDVNEKTNTKRLDI